MLKYLDLCNKKNYIGGYNIGTEAMKNLKKDLWKNLKSLLICKKILRTQIIMNIYINLFIKKYIYINEVKKK